MKEELLKLGCKISKMDPAMFYLHKGDKLSGIVCCHVDDFLHAGEEHFDYIMISLRKRFVAGKVEERITQDKNGIILDQSRYVENIENKAIDPKRALDKHDLLTLEEQTAYRQLIGQINWVVQGSRPDLAFELIDLSTKLKQGNISDLSRAIRAVNRLKDVNSMILFPTLSTDE